MEEPEKSIWTEETQRPPWKTQICRAWRATWIKMEEPHEPKWKTQINQPTQHIQSLKSLVTVFHLSKLRYVKNEIVAQLFFTCLYFGLNPGLT